MVGKPSLTTAGSRATLDSFFTTPEKSITKPALAIAVTTKIYLEEEGTGEAITVTSPAENRDDNGQSVPEDTEVGAKAAPSDKQGDISLFKDKTYRQRRKAERALQRARKARRQMRLAPALTRNKEGEGPVVGGNIMKNKEECQTQAPVTEGAGIKLNNMYP